MSEARLDELERIAGPVSRETYAQLFRFEALFRKWANRINLVAPSTLPELWTRHILDSAQLLRYAPASRRWVDIGSGGGFPGIVCAILRKSIPDSDTILIESNAKKAAFLRAAMIECGLPGRVVVDRIEEAVPALPDCDIVSARALASLGQLLDLARPLLERGATGLFHKGRDYRREIELSSAKASYDLVEHPSLIDADGVVLEIRSRA